MRPVMSAPLPNKSLLGIFGVPILLSALILFGLLSALIGQGGVWFWLSWIALIVPIGVILWFVARPAKSHPKA